MFPYLRQAHVYIRARCKTK